MDLIKNIFYIIILTIIIFIICGGLLFKNKYFLEINKSKFY